ncbi:sugar ABC transporter permease [Pediococcus ethanolidurans]|uniref:sugar ABC transporter permease n=1 Tax=Pediococcus ethanolidurans TaxID=319653 RepID=UPI0021AA0B18|nr:sugar ABC transporter permease [Pediococcus ethanolidurans]MCT4397294.1 sugar ABC transporter permease [Pediococcus ethanolidurans]
MQNQEKKNPRKAMLMSIIPGLGQFYNKQIIKGIAFLAIFIGFIIELAVFGINALIGLFTLGRVPIQDNSLFLMIEGTLQLLLFVVFFLFYAANLYDAKKVAKTTNDGVKPTTNFKEMFKNMVTGGFPYLLTFPAWILMIFTIVFPVVVTLFMAFTNYDFLHIPPAMLLNWVGIRNFFDIFFLSSYRATFGAVFSWTIIWTLCATTLQIVIGIATAVIANQDFIKFKRIYGVIFLLPWAIPAFISIMSFSNMFNDSAGAINVQVIGLLNHIPFVHIPAISWLTNAFWTKVAIIGIQGWLGFPYIYVMVTGILQSIPNDLYEAATLDGASAWQKFTNITAPTIFAVAAPIFITQYTFNFNNFSMIYLFNSGGPGDVGGGAGGTDILISWIYKLTTGQSPQYSLASAVTLMISVIVIGVSLIVFKKSNAFDLGDD